MDDINLLPNGTIILLEGGNKKLMIYGRKQLVTDEDEETIYDYLGVLYPEGYVNADYTYVFNHNDIEEVVFRGFENEEEHEFQKVLSSV
jgi:hypothetical protein